MYAYRTIAGLQEWLNNASVGKRPPPSPIELSLARSGSQPEVSWVLNWRNWRQRCSTRPIFSETSPTVKYWKVCGWSSKNIFLISEQTQQKKRSKYFYDKNLLTHLTILFHPLHGQSSPYFSTSLQGRPPSILGENRPQHFFAQSVLLTGIEHCDRFCIPPFLETKQNTQV